MEKINFNYSLKNIPTPSRSSYQLKLIDKIESAFKRMRWKAFFFEKTIIAMKPREKYLVLNPNGTLRKLQKCSVSKRIY